MRVYISCGALRKINQIGRNTIHWTFNSCIRWNTSGNWTFALFHS